MPNRLITWNDIPVPPTGNLNKSTAVDDLINLVKMKEVRKQGKTNQARKQFEQPEFEIVMDLLEDYNDEAARFFSSAVYQFQTSMIRRIDDCSNFSSGNLIRNFQHDEYSVLIRLCWSTSMRKGVNAPQYILLSASDPRYCVILGLATWIGLSIQTHGRNN